MKDRIQQIIDYKGISAGDLAEILDVQRSNISHILNGRNKPGAVFIEKFLQSFPEINARWLLTGEGSMLLAGTQSKPSDTLRQSIEEAAGRQMVSQSSVPAAPANIPGMEKTIDKVILLYTDGTFTYYNSK